MATAKYVMTVTGADQVAVGKVERQLASKGVLVAACINHRVQYLVLVGNLTGPMFKVMEEANKYGLLVISDKDANDLASGVVDAVTPIPMASSSSHSATTSLKRPRKAKAKTAPKKKVRQKKTKTIPLHSSVYSHLQHCTVYEDWACTLNETNIANNNNKFYIIQLLVDGGNYLLWTNWGRLGNSGQSKEIGAASLDHAKKEFEKKYRAKTGQPWSQRANFVPRAGKYTLIDIDYGDGSSDSEEEDDIVDDELESSSESLPKPPAKKLKTVRKKGKVPVDDSAPAVFISGKHVFEEDGVAWSCKLNQTNIGNNNNKFYLIQLLKDDSANKYTLWTRWGRVGARGQSKPLPMSDLTRAKSEFEKKFKAKTANNWSEKDDFETYSGKYTLLDIDYGDSEEEDEEEESSEADPTAPLPSPKKKSSSKIPASKLDARVQKLVEQIADVSAMQQTMVEMEYDATKMPLGKIKKSTLSKASVILSDIEKVIKKTPGASTKLTNLSSQFYSYVPHSYGMKAPPVISTLKMVKKKMEMVKELGYIEIAQKIMKIKGANENPVDAHYRALNTSLTPLDKHDAMYDIIERFAKNTHAPTHNWYTLKIKQIFRVDRKGEAAAYQPWESDHNQQLLWHGSRSSNYVGILSQGLRIAPPEAPVTGYMFGKGLYFADMCSKSANYCHANKQHPHGIMLLCQTALGSMYEKTQAENSIVKPPSPYLSTFGKGTTGPDPSVTATLPEDSNCSIPLGPHKKTGVKGSSLLYNEFVVYNESQAKIKYLIQVDFLFK